MADPGDDAPTPRPWAPLDPSTPAPAAPPAPPAGNWPPPQPAPGNAWPPPQQTWAPPQYQGWGPPAAPYSRPEAGSGGSARTGPLPMHPMSTGDILEGAFKLLKANLRSILLAVGAIVVPLQLASAFLVRQQVGVGFLNILRDPTVAEAANSNTDPAAAIGRPIATAIVSIVAATFVAAAVAKIVAASYLGEELGPGDALKATVRRVPALLGAWFLAHVLEVIGFAFCVLPGLLLMAMFVMTAPAIAIEELGPIQGMRRSWRLVRPRLWPVLGIALLAGLLAGLLGNLLGAAPTSIGTLLGGDFAWLLIAGGAVLSELISAPIVAIVATLLYFDGRIRNEGFDLQLLAGDLHGRARS